jgi:hypothetical protein
MTQGGGKEGNPVAPKRALFDTFFKQLRFTPKKVTPDPWKIPLFPLFHFPAVTVYPL